MWRYKFTPEQELFIRSNYLLISGKDISQYVGCDPGVIQRFLKRNNLVVSKEIKSGFRIAKMIGKTTFTAAEDEQIRKEYLLMPVKTLADKMKRSHTGIQLRMKHMGLVIPEEIVQRNRKSAQIKPGNVPANKGRKQTEYMDAETIARTAATRFKKGNVPPNAFDHDGIITTRKDHPDRGKDRPYKYIRVSLGKWKLYHHYIWEKVNGPVPKGHCLWFKDGDTMNVVLDNLELITRKENRLRNTGWNNLNDNFIAYTLAWRDKEGQEEILKHPEIIELKRQEIRLNQAIKQQENERKQSNSNH